MTIVGGFFTFALAVGALAPRTSEIESRKQRAKKRQIFFIVDEGRKKKKKNFEGK
jgi:hypothetical protein